jgi:uncharacterized protein (TIGR00730 family)
MSLLVSFTAGTAPRGTGNITANTALHTDAANSAAPVSFDVGLHAGGVMVETRRQAQVCVYCASSRSADSVYRDVAQRLGEILARRGFRIVYGGGAVGSMGALADGALSAGGHVVGVLPRFMNELEWGHTGLPELHLVEDLRTRKHLMLSESDAVVALPGGSGTLEELLEAITLKRLGLFTGPIVLVNTRSFFDPLLELFRKAVVERFMSEKHLAMWSVVERPEEVPDALGQAASWSADAIAFAAL